MGLADEDEFRFGGDADRHFVRAARLEAAARNGLREIGRFAGNEGKTPAAIRERSEGGVARQKAFRGGQR